MQPPIKGQTVLGWDPAFRTGCKLAVVDPTGKVLDTVVIYPTEPQKKIDQAKYMLDKFPEREFAEKYRETAEKLMQTIKTEVERLEENAGR